MPEFGELPPAPEKKIPDWIPIEYHSVADKIDPGALEGPESMRPSILKVLKELKEKENWPTLHQLRGGVGQVPPQMINKVLDLDGKEHHYGQDWQAALLRHPTTKLTPEQVQEIYKSPLNSSIKAETWLHHGQEGETPKLLHPAHFMGTQVGKFLALPDNKIADVIRNSHTHDFDVSRNHHNYDTQNLVDKMVFPNRDYLKNHPLTTQAILEHPSDKIALKAMEGAPIPDETFDKFVARAQPTSNGQPLTEEQKQHLLSRTDDSFENEFWKENKNKGDLLEALARNRELTGQQIDKLTNHVDLNRSLYAGSHSMAFSLISNPNISAETQKKLLQDPNLFAHAMELESQGYSDSIKPEVLNELAPQHIVKLHQLADNQYGSDASDAIRRLATSRKLSSDSLNLLHNLQKQDLENDGKSIIGSHDLASNPNASPELLKSLWHQAKNPTQKEIERIAPEKRSVYFGKTRINDFGARLLENGNLPSDVTTEIVRDSDIFNAGLPSLKPEHHRLMVEKALNGQYPDKGNGLAALSNVTMHTKDPELLRDIYKAKKATWDANNTPEQFKSGSRRTQSDMQGEYRYFINNVHTPKDVITSLHNDFPDATMLEHPNFPQERLEEIANQDPTKLEHARDILNYDAAVDRLKDVDPDKYSYKIRGPSREQDDLNLPYASNGAAKKGREFGSVEIKPSLAKLRVFRDKILESDPTKGELSPKQLGQGPFGGNWKPVQEKNGNISAKKIQELIDSHPSTRYNFAHETWEGAQRHSHHPQRVFKLNVTSDHIKQMKEAGVYGAFRKLSESSSESGHPSDPGHTIGWVRYEHHMKPVIPKNRAEEAEHYEKLHNHDTVNDKPEAIHVDEIQTDMGPNLVSRLRENPERAKDLGVDPEHIEKVNEIVFGKHHPSEVLMEAFRQHHRNQGHHDVPIHILDSKTKAPISGQHVGDRKPLPAHMQMTYTQLPKKLGFQPDKYGASAQQDSPSIKPTPGSIWTDKIRKFEEEIINKALSDIKVGPRTVDYDSKKQAKLPSAVGMGRTNYYDYNHLLTPQHKRAGYQLYVNHVPDSKIKAVLFHKGNHIGDVEGIINPYSGEKLKIIAAQVGHGGADTKHRGKGLGTAAYEAVLAHAKNAAGINTVHGLSHSTGAHHTHNKVAQKHGLAYSALPNYMEGTVQHWPDQESWEAAPTGPFDEKYGKYEYMLKSESPFRSAAFKHKETGQVVETGPHHDITQLPGGEDTLDQYIDGFMGHNGNFYDRDQAAKLVNLGTKEYPKPNGETFQREWLDSFDEEAGMNKNEDGILAMLESDNPTEQILALKSASVMPHHLLVALQAEHPDVRAFAATHESVNGPLLLEMIRQCKDKETGHLLLGHDSCEDEHFNHALEAYPEWFNADGGEIEEAQGEGE